MEWIYVENQDDIPKDETIILEDENFWIGNAYFENGKWYLETFNRTSTKIEFDTIVRYLILKD